MAFLRILLGVGSALWDLKLTQFSFNTKNTEMDTKTWRSHEAQVSFSFTEKDK